MLQEASTRLSLMRHVAHKTPSGPMRVTGQYKKEPRILFKRGLQALDAAVGPEPKHVRGVSKTNDFRH